MFKILVLQTLHNLADGQLEYLIRDRLSFMRFLDLGLEDPVPDATTVWLFREAVAKAGLVAQLFVLFNQHLEAKGYIARGGQIVDATIVSAPKQRNSRDENETIKSGETPAGWEKKPAKNAQKDKVARWTKKHGRPYYGYKNHIGIDAKHKFVRRFAATDASVRDSQKLDDMLDRPNTSSDVSEQWCIVRGAHKARFRALPRVRPIAHSRASRPAPAQPFTANHQPAETRQLAVVALSGPAAHATVPKAAPNHACRALLI